jgi:hypothetical protein
VASDSLSSVNVWPYEGLDGLLTLGDSGPTASFSLFDPSPCAISSLLWLGEVALASCALLRVL